MGEILKRMELMEFLEIIIFDETMILNDPIDSWPICDCLVSFHSKGISLISGHGQGSTDQNLSVQKLKFWKSLNDSDLWMFFVVVLRHPRINFQIWLRFSIGKSYSIWKITKTVCYQRFGETMGYSRPGSTLFLDRFVYDRNKW